MVLYYFPSFNVQVRKIYQYFTGRVTRRHGEFGSVLATRR